MEILKLHNVYNLMIDAQLAGFIMFEEYASSVYIRQVTVHDEWQRLGFGTALVNELRKDIPKPLYGDVMHEGAARFWANFDSMIPLDDLDEWLNMYGTMEVPAQLAFVQA